MSDATSTSVAPLLQDFLAFLRRAAAAQQNGQSETRSILLQAAARLHSIDDESLDKLTLKLIQQQQYNDAITLADLIVQLRPGHVSASFRFGHALQMANRHSDALTPYRQALAIDPAYPHLRNNLAIALRVSGEDPNDEVVLLESAVVAHPRDFNAWINLAVTYLARMDLDQALASGSRAVELVPDNALARNNYSLVLKEAQRWDEAEHHAKAACELAPNDATFRFNFGILRLVRGDYVKGLNGHEARWLGSAELQSSRPVFSAVQWQSEPLAGKTLLVWGEQGMGDLLQCCRFIPLLAQRVHREGGRVIWNSFPQMGALLERSFGEHVDEYFVGGGVESLPRFDYQIPLLSLPFVLHTHENTIPPTIPYLQPDAAASAAWRVRLAGEKRLKVGLAWTGSLKHQRNAFRRVGWQNYARWFSDIDGVAFYSLQPGVTEDVAATQTNSLKITDYTAEFRSFDDTAAFVNELDLVITVCTSVAHLSGALGKRTWVLLDVNPHWPWMLERRDSPWYRSATLYRQRRFGQWTPVLDEVARDLAALAHPPV